MFHKRIKKNWIDETNLFLDEPTKYIDYTQKYHFFKRYFVEILHLSLLTVTRMVITAVIKI